MMLGSRMRISRKVPLLGSCTSLKTTLPRLAEQSAKTGNCVNSSSPHNNARSGWRMCVAYIENMDTSNVRVMPTKFFYCSNEAVTLRSVNPIEPTVPVVARDSSW